MCGLSGMILRGAAPQWDPERVLGAMADSLTHRGPDDRGVWFDPALGVGLSHRRLSIQDLSPLGHQPMCSGSGRYVVVLNGEIYNFLDLRGQLKRLGATFRGGSDTEVLLAGCEAWGIEETLDRACGMFAFALVDRQARMVHLARDRMGEKPLYVGEIRGDLYFASELKAFSEVPGFAAKLNNQAVATYFQRGFIPAPASIFQNIEKVTPASILSISVGEGARREPARRYWSLPTSGAADTLQNEWSDPAFRGLESVLREVVAEQIVSDRPVGAFLSGGIDSSLVVALMQQVSKSPVKTFTIGFEDPKYDEAKHAKAIAAHLGTDHEELYVRPEEGLRLVPELPRNFDEPFADASQLPTMLVAEMARREVVVALSGDGGDESFAGYSRYQRALSLWARLNRLPHRGRQAAGHLLSSAAVPLVDRLATPIMEALSPRRRGRQPSKMLNQLGETLRLSGLDAVYDRSISIWPRPPVMGQVLCGVPGEVGGLKGVRRLMAWDMAEYLPDDVLVKVDRSTMRIGLETRAPLLDRRVVESAWAMPDQVLTSDGRPKYPLRTILYRHVPAELVDRPKQGFAVPLDGWLRHELRDWAESLLAPSELERSGLLDVDAITYCWQRHTGRIWDNGRQLWSVLMFQAWMREYAALRQGR